MRVHCVWQVIFAAGPVSACCRECQLSIGLGPARRSSSATCQPRRMCFAAAGERKTSMKSVVYVTETGLAAGETQKGTREALADGTDGVSHDG